MSTNLSRRELLLAGATGAAALASGPAGAETKREVATKMHLGIVTYNVAKSWDLDTILHHCKEAGIEGVEFRTTHAHGVEPSLTAEQRAAVKTKLSASGLLQTSLGS